MNRGSGERKEMGLRTAGKERRQRVVSVGNHPDGRSVGSEKAKKTCFSFIVN